MAKANHIGAFDFPQGPKVRGGTKLSLMARSGGYVMVRHPHCAPFCLSEKEWANLDDWKKLDPPKVAFSPTGPNSTCM